MTGFYAGVVRKKYTICCVAPDGAQVELTSCYDANAAKVAKEASEQLLALMEDSFEMEEFGVKIIESMESAEDIPMSEVKDKEKLI